MSLNVEYDMENIKYCMTKFDKKKANEQFEV